jgi:hypothetical protein
MTKDQLPMHSILNYFRTLPKRQIVRPWALAVPVLVLLVALPLLRPLRSPDADSMSANELTRLATIQALAENHSQEIETSPFYSALRQRNYAQPPETVQIQNHVYSDKAPVLAVLLAGAYMLFQEFGLSFHRNSALVVYLLTIVGAVIPVAVSAGMIYRMGRLFELRRPWRTMLALAVTFGSGLISYAVVLNAHAPAAALVLGACACLVHITVTKEPTRTGAWLMISGLCAALAAVIDPTAMIFLGGLVLVIATLRWRKRVRFGGVLLYVIGTLPPLALHAVLTVPVTGDLLPPSLHAEMRLHDPRPVAVDPFGDLTDEEIAARNGWVHASVVKAALVLGALVGSHGIFSHFPVVLLGVFGIVLVLRRHWPIATKTMAAVTLAGGCLIVLAYVFLGGSWTSSMFGPRWSIAFLPLLVFWAGAWLRKKHHPIIWSLAALLLVFSMAVSVLGTTAPFLNTPGRYTAAAALKQFLHPTSPVMDRPMVASN